VGGREPVAADVRVVESLKNFVLFQTQEELLRRCVLLRCELFLVFRALLLEFFGSGLTETRQ